MKRSFGKASTAAVLACTIVAGCAGRSATITGSADAPGMAPQAATSATSRVTRVEITRREPFAEGARFGDVGAYEKLVGTATLELDPRDPRNAAILDKDAVPRNAAGNIEYSTEVYILRPVDPARGNGKLLFEINNRGNKRIWTYVNDSPSTPAALNDPKTVQDAGNGFLMRQGYTMAWPAGRATFDRWRTG